MVKFDTKTVHFSKNDGSDQYAKTKPIYQTSAFKFKSLEDLESYYTGEKSYLYSRMENPNTNELGHAVASLEEAPAGIATSSGMSAILAAILSLLKSGDHIIVCEDLYGGSFQLIFEELKEYGIESTAVPFHDHSVIEANIKENTKALFTETVSNPLLRVEDIPGIVAIAKKHNLMTIMDNTFATPYLLQPYKLGVDLVVHSATKYIGGHSDVTAGVAVGNEELISKVKTKVTRLGMNLSPFEAWLACRGLKTLSLRMKRQSDNAQILADSLRRKDEIETVYYPEFVSEKGNGAIVTIKLDKTKCDIRAFFKALKLTKIVATLAGVETSLSHSRSTSHRALSEEQCKRLGIDEQIIRVSVGIEDIEDITADFNQALSEARLSENN